MSEIETVSEIWFDWQIRSLFFLAFILWVALGTGIRSPVLKCSILSIGGWLTLFLPLFHIVIPSFEVPVLLYGSEKSLSDINLNIFAYTLFIVAFLVSVAFLLKLFASLKALIRLNDSLIEANDLHELLESCSDKLGLLPVTSCYRSIHAHAPLTYGVLKHRIVLPMDSESWSKEHLQICLMHELWHVKRADWLTQQVVSLMHLFNLLNPFAWFLRSQLAQKMEESVDKLCVHTGINMRDYASVLLQQTRFTKNHIGLLSPTFFGAHRYGESALHRRVGYLVNEPFGWEEIPKGKLIPLGILLIFVAMIFASMVPVGVSSESQPNDRWAYKSAKTLSQLSITDVSLWRSMQLPAISSGNVLSPVEYEMPELPDSGNRLQKNWVFGQDGLKADGLSGSQIDIPMTNQFVAERLSAIRIPRKPDAVYLEKPVFPRREVQRNREGWVELAFDLNERGEPINIIVLESSGAFSFERAAISALSASYYNLENADIDNLITRDLTQVYMFQFADQNENEINMAARSPP